MPRKKTDVSRIVRYIASHFPEQVSILEMIDQLKTHLEDIITYNLSYDREPISWRSVEAISRAFLSALREEVETLAPEIGEDNVEAIVKEAEEELRKMLDDLRGRFYGSG